jgi:hypothetical protein
MEVARGDEEAEESRQEDARQEEEGAAQESPS